MLTGAAFPLDHLAQPNSSRSQPGRRHPHRSIDLAIRSTSSSQLHSRVRLSLRPAPPPPPENMSSQRPTHIALPRSTSFGQSGANQPLRSPGSPAAGTSVPLASPNSPRTSFLPSFMRTRPRAGTLTRPSTGNSTNPSSPNVEAANPMDGSGSDVPNGGARGLGNILRRRISNTNGTTIGLNRAAGTSRQAGSAEAESSSAPAIVYSSVPASDVAQKTYRIRLVPHLESSRSLPFEPVVRDVVAVAKGSLPPFPLPDSKSATRVNDKAVGYSLKIGRFTDKTPQAGDEVGTSAPVIIGAGGGGEPTSIKVAFRSKVVSRAHAEIWCEEGGKFFVRDSASSSGSFLNHIRLADPNTPSGPYGLKDGDVLQLGVDYQGGAEEMYRCVKMRVEVGREWQRGANEFNTNAMKQLKELGGNPDTASITGSIKNKDKKKANVTDCCICLFSVTICQSLFIAPCSHVFHYKCIRPLLQQHHPGFSCPLCRTFANLEEDVEVEDAWGPASRRNSTFDRKVSTTAGTALAPEVNLDTDPNLTTVSLSRRPSASEPSPDQLEAEAEDEVMTDDELNVEGLSITRRPELVSHQTYADQAATPMNSTFLSTLADSR